MINNRWVLALSGLAGMAVIPANDAMAGCAGKYPLRWSMPLDSGDVGKSMSAVLKQSGFGGTGHLRNNDNRLSFANVPGGGVGIRMSVPKGENKIVSFHMSSLGNPGADKACLTLEVYLSGGFDFATAGTKLGWGLWGGDSESKSSGGVAASGQTGWSVRNVTNGEGSRAYSYHLNRKGNFGEQIGSRAKLKAGAWNKVEVEVTMNTIGASNGTLRVWINGSQTASASNLQWRKKGSWAIRGLKFTDMWGGVTSDKKNFSPKAQEIFYKNYKIYASSGGLDGGGGGNDDGGGFAGTSGAFGAVVPAQNSTIASPSQLVWEAHDDADKYYLKIADGKNKTKYSKTIAAKSAGCNNGGSCTVSYPGTLGNGAYKFTLRAMRGSKKLKEINFSFKVGSDSGASASSGSGSFGPVFPAANGKIAAPAQLVWDAHPDADGYYIKIVDGKNKTKLSKTYTAKAASCANGGVCDIKYAGSKLGNGGHKMTLQALKSKKKLKSVTFSFNVGSGGSGGLADTSSAGGGSGQFGPATPRPGSSYGNLPTLAWTGDSNADKYYIKIVNSQKKVMMQKSFAAGNAGCKSGGNCSYKYFGSKLVKGAYKMTLRAVGNGKKLDEDTFNFAIN